MRVDNFWKRYVQELVKREVVLDLGGGTPFKGKIKESDLLPHTRYYCMDYAFAGRPHVVGDIQRLPFKSECCDGILNVAVLEHVAEPQRAVDEMFRILKPGGILVGYVPFLYPYHGSPSDYWRFTEEGLRFMLSRFDEVEVVAWGDYVYTTLGFAVGFNLAILARMDRISRFGGEILKALLKLRPSTGKASDGKAAGRKPLRSLEKSVVGLRFYAVK